jgi:hypothetical protein
MISHCHKALLQIKSVWHFIVLISRILFENRVLRRLFGPKKDEVTG